MRAKGLHPRVFASPQGWRAENPTRFPLRRLVFRTFVQYNRAKRARHPWKGGTQDPVRHLLIMILNSMLRRLRRPEPRRPKRLPKQAAVPLVEEANVQPAARPVSHSPEDLLRRWHSLTARQKEVACLISHNQTNGQIAENLSISQWTAKTHVQEVLKKFRVHSKAELRDLISGCPFVENDPR